ncbi:tetratricopeptide repeat-containing sensor histidine kinase [Dyadobacter tibetensis]|uniref:tetratricopeptide repeat-containing sensor histidine kinase n=1 Tax=Dyadobacter tibetensis TaxID=1211851 RepID=UPI00046E9696|nr:histidine kinase [Dyadobacter tibetensis]
MLNSWKTLKVCIILIVHGLIPNGTLAYAPERSSRGSDNILSDQFLTKAENFARIYQNDSAEYYYRKTYQIAAKKADSSSLFKYFSSHSKFLYNIGQYEKALKICQMQLELSLKAGDKKKIAAAYNNLGLQHQAIGQLSKAAEYMILALKMSESLDDKVNQQKYYSNISSIFLDLKDKKNSLLYAQKGYELAKTISNKQAARSLINLAASEALNNQPKKCIAHLKEVVAIAHESKDSLLQVHAFINLGDIENREHKYQNALDYYLQAEAILGSTPMPEYRMYIEYGLANSLKNLKEFKKAYPYLNRTLNKAENLMPKNDLKEVYLLAADIYEEINRPALALAVLKKYTLLNDSLTSITTQRAIHEIETKYQISKRDQKLTDQKLQLTKNEIEIEKKNKWILMIMVLLSLVMALSIIVYLIYRNKTQYIQLSLLKAQIHPHFLFNTLNNLYALSLKKSDQAPNLVLGLSEILRYILYECNQPEISLEKEITMIQRYIELEAIRYTNRLEVNLNIDHPTGNQLKIAPLLLLPLVENAFKHGINKLSDQGWINIESRVSKNTYIFKVSNNTSALPVSHVSKQKGHIGLINIRKRLQLLYPSRHQLKIVEDSDVFIVTMSIKV